MTLEVVWYFVIILALIAYAVLDGFDLGVGALHLFTKKDEHRRIFLNAIGPVWDGNEVWLVIVVGAMFAGFPEAYATLFSSFYNLTMGLLASLIFRAVAIEFRSKHESPRWRATWDVVFCVASISIAFGIGLVLGNLIEGIPLDANKDFIGTFSDFFSPYTLLLGLTTVALFMMHGAIYLVMKTEGKLHNDLRNRVRGLILFFLLCYGATTIATWIYRPHMIYRMIEMPWLFLVGLAAFLAILNIPRQMSKRNDGWAFIFSSISIALLLSLFAIGTFPLLIRSSVNPDQNSLSLYNAASSPLTLKVLMIIVLIGLPLILAYGFYIYRIFRGKVKLEHTSY